MPSVILSEVAHSFGDREILRGVNLILSRGRKAALAGANGSGKSTLMRVLIGELVPDSGSVVLDKDTCISYLPQSGASSSPLRLDRRATVYQEVEKAFAAAARLADRVRELEHRLGGYKEDSPELRRLLERYQVLQERLEASGYHRRREAVERVLQGLGFDRRTFGQPVGSFSQGWQMRIALARVLCEGADVLLLDEPTNFLDLEARTWLEGFLQETGAGVLVVSHDRFFLDATVDEVAELYLGRLSVYPGSFSSYEQRRVRELEQIGEAYERQQEEIARVEQFIRRFRYKATKARQVQSRIKMLERMERIETPPVRKVMHFSFPQPPHGGRLALQGEELAKSYGGRTVFAGVSLELSRAEKWALVGPNGAGKSTLMRILAGREEPDGGRIRYGSGARIGYYRPEEVESLEEAKSVEELVGSWAAPAMMPHLRSLLGAFLFRGEEVYKPVSVLSGGEKSRLALLRLLMQPANLLFLDEPTNHLDLQSKDVLLDALARYSGTVMFVSHDRDFIAALSDRVAEIGGGRLRVYPGDYSYYLWRKQQEGARVTPATQATPGRTRGEQAAEPGEAFGERTAKRIPAGAKADRAGLSASQASRLQDKAQERELRRLVREEEQLLGRLEELNEEHSRLEQVLSTEEVYRDGEQVKRIKEKIEEIRASQERLMQRWEQVDKSRRSYEA